MRLHRSTHQLISLARQLCVRVQAVDTAVAAAVADARVKTKEEVEAASAAKKAAADQQLLRELEDKVEALSNQLNTATEQLRSTETALRCGSDLFRVSYHAVTRLVLHLDLAPQAIQPPDCQLLLSACTCIACSAQIPPCWFCSRDVPCISCREAQKEMELLEKKLDRTEKARAQEVCSLSCVYC